MIDKVVHRHQLRATLSRICAILMDGRESLRPTAKPFVTEGTVIAPPALPDVDADAEAEPDQAHAISKPNGHGDRKANSASGEVKALAEPDDATEQGDDVAPAKSHGSEADADPSKPARGDTSAS